MSTALPTAIASPAARPGRWGRLLAIASVLVLAGSVSAAAAPQEGVPPPDSLQGAYSGDLTELGDREVLRRLREGIVLLEDQELAAEVWQYGFVSVYAMGIGLGALEAGLAEDGSARVEPIVGGVKAVGGTVQMLLRPHPGRRGADDVLAMPSDTPAARRRQLQRAEAILARAEQRAGARYDWRPHLGNLVVNLIGGGIVWGLGESRDAISSTALGLAVGEAMIWLEPRQPARDAERYRRFLARAAPALELRLELAPQPRGLALRLRY